MNKHGSPLLIGHHIAAIFLESHEEVEKPHGQKVKFKEDT